MMEKPSVMATLTLERCGHEFVEKMISRGMTSVRINSAHVTALQLKDMVASLRKTDSSLKILTDTKGAEVRTTAVEIPIPILRGETVTFAYGPDKISTRETIWINAPEVEQHISVGRKLTVDDGAIEMEVCTINNGSFSATALYDGSIDGCKTISFPGIDLMHLPSVTERDRKAIMAAREAGVDIIAHSFVRTAEDVKAVRRLIEGTDIRLYAKIECNSALRNLKEIMERVDGILFARGDLGNAIPLSELPSVQWEVLRECGKVGIPVILSTQILQSMMNHPSPTRAEVNDIFLGVLEGASTFLLCGETAVGSYPLEAVDVMAKTIGCAMKTVGKIQSL